MWRRFGGGGLQSMISRFPAHQDRENRTIPEQQIRVLCSVAGFCGRWSFFWGFWLRGDLTIDTAGSLDFGRNQSEIFLHLCASGSTLNHTGLSFLSNRQCADLRGFSTVKLGFAWELRISGIRKPCSMVGFRGHRWLSDAKSYQSRGNMVPETSIQGRCLENLTPSDEGLGCRALLKKFDSIPLAGGPASSLFQPRTPPPMNEFYLFSAALQAAGRQRIFHFWG